MDLLQTVRKEGSRGGRANFTWDDVKNDTQRENYLGHSLMAPVGRWQKGRDLQWYSRNTDNDGKSEAEKRREEIRKIKQQEEDAMARALGYDVPPRKDEAGDATGANAAPIEKTKEVERALKESAAERRDDSDGAGGRGLGYGSYSGPAKSFDHDERLEGTGVDRPRRGKDEGRQRNTSTERHRRPHVDYIRRDGHERDRHRSTRHSRYHSHSRSRSPIRNHRRERSRIRDHRRERSPDRSRDRRRDDDRRPQPPIYHYDYHERRYERYEDRRQPRNRSDSPRNRKRSWSPRHRR